MKEIVSYNAKTMLKGYLQSSNDGINYDDENRVKSYEDDVEVQGFKAGVYHDPTESGLLLLLLLLLLTGVWWNKRGRYWSPS